MAKDTIARFGGDEFLILVENITDIRDATQIAERILKVCKKPFYLNEKKVFITTSIGIVLSTDETKNPSDFLRDADIALYCSKSDGKSRYRVFDAQMHAEAVDRLHIEMGLRRAHKLEMDVVAEGVETIEQLKLLQAIGCQQIQGNLFSAPLTSAQVTTVLKSL